MINLMKHRRMILTGIAAALIYAAAFCIPALAESETAQQTPESAASSSKKAFATVYKGQDYSRVYDYYYYTKKYPSVVRTVGKNKKKVLKHFVTVGIRKGRRGIKSFQLRSYAYGNPALRKKFGNNHRKYYLHYQNIGYKYAKYRASATGVTKIKSPAVKYNGVSYAKVYDYTWYLKKHPEIKKMFGYNDTAVLEYYVKNGFPNLEKAKESVADNAFEVVDKNVFRRMLGATQTARKTNQIIVVIDHELTLWQKNSKGSWRQKLKAYCGYGKSGLSDNHTEGDMTTPIGSFPILHAFGTAANPGTDMTWRNITSNSYWSGERATYNTWVESTSAISGEHLIDYYQYKYAMAIGFNVNPAVYGKGSAIFVHCKSTDHWYTGGCISLENDMMVSLLQKCKNGTYIIIVRSRDDISSY